MNQYGGAIELNQCLATITIGIYWKFSVNINYEKSNQYNFLIKLIYVLNVQFNYFELYNFYIYAVSLLNKLMKVPLYGKIKRITIWCPFISVLIGSHFEFFFVTHLRLKFLAFLLRIVPLGFLFGLFVSFRKYRLKSLSSFCFIPAYSVAVAHRNHFSACTNGR